MTTSSNPIGFSNTHAYELPLLILQQTGIRRKIGELEKVTDILLMEPWTPDDVTQGNKLTILREEWNFDLSDINGFNRRGNRREKEQSPFWACVNTLKACFSVA